MIDFFWLDEVTCILPIICSLFYLHSRIERISKLFLGMEGKEGTIKVSSTAADQGDFNLQLNIANISGGATVMDETQQ